MKLTYRRTILDDLYGKEKEKEINAAYVKFLENPGIYARYYVPKAEQKSSDGEYTSYYGPSEEIDPGFAGEPMYTFDEINKYKEEEKKNKGELKDIASPPPPPPPPPPDVSEVLDDALAAMDNSTATATATATPPPPPPPPVDGSAFDIMEAAEKEFHGVMGGSSRKYLRRRFKKSKSKSNMKSKSKKSKSKSKTKPKLKSKYKTKYRKQNK
jgi:hypothetical protein